MTEDEFYAEVARECRCCPECCILPCPACAAGGICDQTCFCERDDESEDDDAS